MEAKIPCGLEDTTESNPLDIKLQALAGWGYTRHASDALPVWGNKPHVSDVLAAIAFRYPTHDWSLQKGVLNFRLRSRSPLSKKISKIEFKNEPTNLAVGKICRAVGIRTPAGSSSLMRGRSSDPNRFERITLSLQNKTALQALNEIVRKDGKAMWYVRLDPSTDRYLVGAYSWR